MVKPPFSIIPDIYLPDKLFLSPPECNKFLLPSDCVYRKIVVRVSKQMTIFTTNVPTQPKICLLTRFILGIALYFKYALLQCIISPGIGSGDFLCGKSQSAALPSTVIHANAGTSLHIMSLLFPVQSNPRGFLHLPASPVIMVGDGAVQIFEKSGGKI